MILEFKKHVLPEIFEIMFQKSVNFEKTVNSEKWSANNLYKQQVHTNSN